MLRKQGEMLWRISLREVSSVCVNIELSVYVYRVLDAIVCSSVDVCACGGDLFCFLKITHHCYLHTQMLPPE